MKTRILRIITAILAVCSAVAAADLGGLTSILPPQWAPYVLGASALALALKEIGVVVGDIIDDGTRNGSFK